MQSLTRPGCCCAGYSTVQRAEAASLFPTFRSHVHGVLYKLTRAEMDKLKRKEGGYALQDMEVGTSADMMFILKGNGPCSSITLHAAAPTAPAPACSGCMACRPTNRIRVAVQQQPQQQVHGTWQGFACLVQQQAKRA